MSMTWQELKPEQELTLVKPPIEKLQLVKYAGASKDFNMIHQDEETAKKVGLPGIIAHGMLSMGFLGQLAQDAAGTNGFVSRLNVQFRGMVFPGDTVTCKAVVTEKNADTKTVDLDIWAETDAGKPVTKGQASITFHA
ncbi:Acyl dehydratase [Alteribacillus persepolensis]|uniref:Acyl dehydratase n=1 Tax=Alteribacillus persepolensis TaxID=568899 RepID=A0A1G8AVA3_9BACI|nr:MaoC/PaaZ C-terminal domain-containing protein [Alteribacillus persepolensis]SDH24905.1 Acyl dehydratase [Alteribacillus persepolensis]